MEGRASAEGRRATINEAEVIVVGGGLTGLLTARALLRKSIKVVVIEASDQLGGHVKPPPPAALEPFAASSSFSERWNGCSSFGKFLLHRHDFVRAEVAEYRDVLHTGVYSIQDRLHVQSLHQPPMKWSNYLRTIQSRSAFADIIRQIDTDADRIELESGFRQVSADYLDVPFSRYLTENLAISDPALLEFFSFVPFVVLGGHAQDVSTIMVLHLTAAMRGFQNVLNHLTASDCIKEGFPALVSCIADSCRTLGCTFLFEKPIIAISCEHSPRPEPRIPNYEYPPNPNPIATCTVRLVTGEQWTAKGVVLTVPLNSLLSIAFTPTLPPTLHRAAERCNNSKNWMQVLALGRHVSTRVPALFNLSHESAVQESHVLQRGSVNGEDVALVSVSGRRDQFLVNLPRVVKAAHPGILPIARGEAPAGNPAELQVWTRDQVTERWLRSGRFLLRPGTARLHREAWEEAESLWQTSHCLYIACSELSPYWPGWVEGCGFVAHRASQAMIPHIIPPKIARNFAAPANHR